MSASRFENCTPVDRLLYSAFLVLVGVGYLMALAYLYASHRGHDGKPGLSMLDIAENYYGNRSGTRLEAAIRGPMAAYIQPEERHHIVAWLKSGADEPGYQRDVLPVLRARCFGCHAGALGIPDLSTYQAVRQVAEVDTGVSLYTLVKLSHIHLFGVGLLLVGVGLIFRHTRLPTWLQAALVVTPFLAILADIVAWFLTKWDPVYAYTVVAAGALLGLSLATQIFISLYQIWIPSRQRSVS